MMLRTEENKIFCVAHFLFVKFCVSYILWVLHFLYFTFSVWQFLCLIFFVCYAFSVGHFLCHIFCVSLFLVSCFVCVTLSLFYTVSMTHFLYVTFILIFILFLWLHKILANHVSPPPPTFLKTELPTLDWNPICKHYKITNIIYTNFFIPQAKLYYLFFKWLVVEMFLSTDLEDCWDCIIISDTFLYFTKLAKFNNVVL